MAPNLAAGGSPVTAWQVLFSVLLGLAINECSELSPWCAGKLVRWSARVRYTDAARADARAEELTALIEDRPGKLFKLITALGFVVAAVTVSARQAVTRGNATPREQQAEIKAYSGPSTWIGLLSDVIAIQARTIRLVGLMIASTASFALVSAGTPPLFSFLFRDLGMLGGAPAVGMAVPGVITIQWWRRRARSRPGTWIGLLWEVAAGSERIRKVVVLAAVSAGSIALLFAGIEHLLHGLGMWGEVPAAGIVAFWLVTPARWRRKVIRKVMGRKRRLDLSRAGRHLTRGPGLRRRSAARCGDRSRRQRPGGAGRRGRRGLLR